MALRMQLSVSALNKALTAVRPLHSSQAAWRLGCVRLFATNAAGAERTTAAAEALSAERREEAGADVHKKKGARAKRIERFESRLQYLWEEEKGKSMRIVSATVVMRCPLMVPDTPPAIAKFEAIQEELESKKEFKIPPKFYEIPEDVKKRMKNMGMTEEEMQPAKYPEEPKRPRITEADNKNDLRSLERKLDRELYLLVKKERSDHTWQFPQGGVEIESQETLREAAERELREETGLKDPEHVHFLANHPIGWQRYFHPEKLHGQYDGTKVFFMLALLSQPVTPKLNGELVDYMWLTRDEIEKYVSPSLWQSARQMLR